MSNTRSASAHRPDPAPQPLVRGLKYSRAPALAEPKAHATLEQLLEPKPDTGGPSETPEQYREHCEGMIDGLKASGWLDDLVKQVEADMHDRVHLLYVLDVKSVQEYLGISRYGVEKLVKDGKIRQFTIAPQYRDQKPKGPHPCHRSTDTAVNKPTAARLERCPCTRARVARRFEEGIHRAPAYFAVPQRYVGEFKCDSCVRYAARSGAKEATRGRVNWRK